MGMDVNGEHYNWGSWSYVFASVKHVCGEYLHRAFAIPGLVETAPEDREKIGVIYSDHVEGNCLESMQGNSHDIWPEGIAMKVARDMEEAIEGGVISAVMEAENMEEEIDFCHETVSRFIKSIKECPQGVMFN
ncbi:hypothetical protein OAF30_05145 [Flavobacteriales bacterium]|nr:hypothetical protein [Flavobacteriales bacterium]